MIGVYGEDCGRIVRVSRALADLLATTPEQLVGTSICDRIHSADRARAVDEFARLIDGAIFCEGQGRLVAKDGRVRWVRVDAGLLAPEDVARDGILPRDHVVRAVAMLHIAQIDKPDGEPHAPAE